VELDFNEVTEVYAGLHLKKDFLEIGTQALKEHGAPDSCLPELEDDTICFKVLSHPYFTEESFQEFCRMGVSRHTTLEESTELAMEDRDAYCEVLALIKINRENDEITIGSIEGDFGVYRDVDGESEYIEYLDESWYLTQDEWDQIVERTEVFLNAAVDLEKM